MSTRSLPVLVACALALAATPVLSGEPGNMMKMTTTTRMNLAGMPAIGPLSHSMDVCTSAKEPDPTQMMKHRGDCQVSDYKHAGDTITYHMTCGGQMQMSGDGEFTMLPGGGIRGSIHATGQTAGQAMTMDMAFDGQRIGECDYTPPAPEG